MGATGGPSLLEQPWHWLSFACLAIALSGCAKQARIRDAYRTYDELVAGAEATHETWLIGQQVPYEDTDRGDLWALRGQYAALHLMRRVDTPPEGKWEVCLGFSSAMTCPDAAENQDVIAAAAHTTLDQLLKGATEAEGDGEWARAKALIHTSLCLCERFCSAKDLRAVGRRVLEAEVRSLESGTGNAVISLGVMQKLLARDALTADDVATKIPRVPDPSWRQAFAEVALSRYPNDTRLKSLAGVD